jgi:hypothetical protein
MRLRMRRFERPLRRYTQATLPSLARLIDAEPRLLHERMMGPEAYRLRQRPGYFRDPKLIELLIERGARTDLRDTLWDATPLEWAMHGERSAAIAALERLG